MSQLISFGAKAAIAVLFAMAGLAQLLVAAQLGPTVNQRIPDMAYLSTAATIWFVAVVACGQVVLIVVWRLVSFVDGSRIFSAAAFAHVRVMIGAGIVAATLILGAFIGLNVLELAAPSVMIALLCVLVFCIAFVLVVVVMMGLLRRAAALEASAAALEAELAEVV